MRIVLPLRVRVGLGLAGALLLAGVAAVAIAVGQGAYQRSYPISAVFDSSSQGLDTLSDVKVRGVTVGTVGRIDLLPDGRAELRLDIRPGVQIADTASATIEPLSIFGPRFVRLEPGANELSGPFLEAGDSLRHTSQAPDFVEVVGEAGRRLRAIDPAQLAAVVTAVADGVGGLGPEIGRTLDAGAELTGLTRANLPELRAALRDLALLSSTLADRAGVVGPLAQDLGSLLPEVTSRRERVAELLDGVATLSGDLATILAEDRPSLDATLRGLDPVVGALHRDRELVPALVEMLDQFFFTLGEALHIPGPEDTLIGAIRAGPPTDPCHVAAGVLCPFGSPFAGAGGIGGPR